MTPDYLRGYRDAVEEAANALLATSGRSMSSVHAEQAAGVVRALLPKAAEPTCARCGGTKVLKELSPDVAEPVLISTNCRDCSPANAKPETT